MFAGIALMSVVKAVPGHWVLAVMMKLQPTAPREVLATYGETSEAIADAATRDPLFSGEDGAIRTASVLLAIAFYESHFIPTAIGDHGRSFGLFQINATNFPNLTGNALLSPRDAAPIAIKLIRTSLRNCGEFPWNERLGWYAAGRGQCREAGRKASKPRMFLADKIFKERDSFPDQDSSEKPEVVND